MIRNVDTLNIGLMLASCLLAYVLPFELVLLSYAFLGPAHYLTQISWLHDRRYFVDRRGVFLSAGVVSFLICLLVFFSSLHNDVFIYALYALALSGAGAYVFAKSAARFFAILAAAFLGLMGLQALIPDMITAVVLLLPTVVHIYVFTGAFILLGALKSKSIAGFLSFPVFVFCGGVFFFVEPHDTIYLPEYVANNIGIFESVANYLADVFSFGGWIEGHAMLGFLSFAYTYHYLNWFSKVEIIKWHDISRVRLGWIAALYVLSIGLYLYDYRVGFFALLFLSLLHVILEFPLNIITFKTLGQAGAGFVKSRLHPYFLHRP